MEEQHQGPQRRARHKAAQDRYYRKELEQEEADARNYIEKNQSAAEDQLDRDIERGKDELRAHIIRKLREEALRLAKPIVEKVIEERDRNRSLSHEIVNAGFVNRRTGDRIEGGGENPVRLSVFGFNRKTLELFREPNSNHQNLLRTVTRKVASNLGLQVSESGMGSQITYHQSHGSKTILVHMKISIDF